MSGKEHRPKALTPKAKQLVPAQAPQVAAVPMPEDAKKLSMFDTGNAYSLVRLLPDGLSERLKKVNRDLFLIREEEFEAKYKPDEVDCRLRLKFWDEWLAVIHEPGRRISPQNIYYGVCTSEYFFEKVVNDEAKFVWMVMPPTDYDVALREIFYKSISRLREIIQLPFIQNVPMFSKGQPVLDLQGLPVFFKKIDRGLISEIRQTAQMLSDRVMGAVAQKWQIDQRSLHLSATVPDGAMGEQGQVAGKPQSLTITDDEVAAFERQIAAIDSRLQPYSSEAYVLEAEKVINAKEARPNRQDAPEETGEAPTPDV